MTESHSRTTLNLSKLSDRIERLRTDSAWKKLKLAQKVTLVLEEYLELAESGKLSKPKHDSEIQDVSGQNLLDIDNDPHLKEKLQVIATARGQSLVSVLRWVSILGLDLLDIGSRLQITPPQAGDLQKWRIEFSNVDVSPEGSGSKQDESLIKYLYSLKKRPSDTEIKKAATRLHIDSQELIQVCDRLFARSDNGNQ